MSTRSLSGLILTRQWIETEQGLELIYWFATEQGPVRWQVPGQEAVCFYPASQHTLVCSTLQKFLRADQWRTKPTQLKNFSRQDVHALYFSTQRLLFECRDKLNDCDIKLVETDIRPTDRFLMERFITGAACIDGEFEQRECFAEVSHAQLKPVEYRPQLNAISIDIETDYEAAELYSIGIYSDTERLVLMRNDGPQQQPAATPELQLQYCKDERSLLSAFIATVQRIDPDLLMGWNVVNFDLRCLQQFADRVDIALAIGRNNEQIVWRKAREGNDRFYALVPGRAVLDGIELMRSATYQFENFSLEHVARKLLNRGKLVDDVDQRGQEITQLFEQDKPALARYNLEDCRLVWDIFAQEKLIAFAIERSLLTGLELDRYGGSVAAFDYLYLPRLHRKGYVAPSLDHLKHTTMSPGGYVMQSVPGIHDNVIVLDFKSLYPSIIRTFNVDPLALIVGLQEADSIEGYEGARFSRKEYILPDLISGLWSARDRAKADKNAVLSQAIKIIMNSFYGVLGTLGCRFFDSRLVSSITRRGHEIIIESKNYLEARGFEVIYGDTDSVFVLLRDVDTQDVSSVGRALASELNAWWRQRLADQYGVHSCLELEFETHFSRFLMPTIRGSDAGSKKRYAGVVGDISQPGQYRLIFKGLETVRSDWSPLARNFQKELYERVFLDKPYEDYVKSVVNDILGGKFDSELVLRKRLRRKLDDYVKNVPPHVQAARKAEAIRKERKLPSMYNSGGWVEYVMTTSGPEPRHYQQSPVDMDFYIDRQLTPIADAILIFKGSSMHDILNKQMGLF